MKNACVVLKNNGTAILDEQTFAPLQAFVRNGYFFDEIRILDVMEETRIKNALSSLKSEYDALLLLCDKRLLTLANTYALHIFQENFCAGSFGEARIYDDNNTVFFLLSSNDFETGIEYAQKACIPYLRKKYGQLWEKLVVRSMGANETHVNRLIDEAKRAGGENMRYLHRRKYDEDVIEIFYGEQAPKMLVDNVLRNFAEQLGDTMYATDDVSLEEQLVNILKVRGKKICVAESFTGGGVAKRIVSVPGVSEVYVEGLNTYQEASKMFRLGVSDFTLKSFGAVSEKTAYEMALGALNTSKADISIATTGIAGPKSDRSMMPVGLCYLAVGTRERILVYRYKFDGTRKEITERAINYALFLAYKQLKNL